MTNAACTSHELAPVKLQMLARLGLIAAYRLPPSSGWAQRVDKRFQLADPARVAQGLEPGQHGDTVVQMVLLDPAPDLRLKGIELRCPRRAGFGCWRAVEVFAHGWARDIDRPRNLA